MPSEWPWPTHGDQLVDGSWPDFLPLDGVGSAAQVSLPDTRSDSWRHPGHTLHGLARLVFPSAPAAPAPAQPIEAVDVPRVRQSASYAVAKRLLDVIASAVGLVVLTPIFIAIAVLIKRDDAGPAIYRREIVGLAGRRVYAYKFRTMIQDADGYLQRHPELQKEYATNVKLRRDPRVTRIGAKLRRSSLDELPQLLNVVRGEMSLVGPRMIHPSEQTRYGAFAQARQTVRPGITGLWQVRGRQEVSYEVRIQLDDEYLRRRSFWLDLQILARTVGVLLRRYGAY